MSAIQNCTWRRKKQHQNVIAWSWIIISEADGACCSIFFFCFGNGRHNRHVKPRVLCLDISTIVHTTVSLSCSHTFTRMQIHLTCNWRRRLLPVLHISTANRTTYRYFSTQLGSHARKFCYIRLRAGLHANIAANRKNHSSPSVQRSSYRKAAEVWPAWMAKWPNECVLVAMISKQTGDALSYLKKNHALHNHNINKARATLGKHRSPEQVVSCRFSRMCEINKIFSVRFSVTIGACSGWPNHKR